MDSKKLFAFEFVGGVSRLRVPQPSNTKFDPDVHFQPREQSPYLRGALNGVPYATFKTDSMDEMENILANGFRHKITGGVVWRVWFAYWKDQTGRALLSPESDGIKSLTDVGIDTFMKSPDDFLKVGKYGNRLMAELSPPTKYVMSGGKVSVKVVDTGVWGDEVSWNPDEPLSLVLIDQEPGANLSEDDRTLSVKYVSLAGLNPLQKALVDGMIPLSGKACKLLKLSDNPVIGDVWRGTFGTVHGLGKGHMPYNPGQEVDIIIYGPKEILKTKRFFFGSMGPLHAGVPHTDIQAFVNFGFHRPNLAVKIAKLFMREVVLAMGNEGQLRRVLLKHTSFDEADTEFEVKMEKWILRRALRYGISMLRFPALYRRARKYLMERVMACTKKARIPMESVTYAVAKYGYVLGDLNAIESDGGIDESKAIPEGTIVFPDLPAGTQVVCYRQPSENSNAWVSLKVIAKPEFGRFVGRGICLLGKGADKVLGRLGGGDMDDQFVIVHDPEWVEAFHTLRPYPETYKVSDETLDVIQAEQHEDPLLRDFTDELMGELQSGDFITYTNRHVDWQMRQARKSRAGIGPVVNYGMIDMLLSDPDHKSSMMNDLGDKPEFANWLEDREPYQAAHLMTNLERVIDANVKDSTLIDVLGDVSGQIKQFHVDCKVYPSCVAMGLGIPGQSIRVPQAKLKKGDFTIARSLTCRALETILYMQKSMETFFIKREWLMVAPYDSMLFESYPKEAELMELVRGKWRKGDITMGEKKFEPLHEGPTIQSVWIEGWRDAFGSDEEDLTTGKAYERICNKVRELVGPRTEEEMEHIACHVYYATYTSYHQEPGIDPHTGDPRSYPDGLLWSPVFANHFVDALRKAWDYDHKNRLAGYYLVPSLRPELRAKLEKINVLVKVSNRQVYVQDSDGEYTIRVGTLYDRRVPTADDPVPMHSGVIEFRKPCEICLPDKDTVKLAQLPLTTLYRLRGKPEVEPTEPQPIGRLGELIIAALKSLGVKS